MRDELARRRGLLRAALGFTRLRWRELAPPPAVAVARSLDSWRGLGAVVVGMHAQGYDIGLQQYPNGWRANFSSIRWSPPITTCAIHRVLRSTE